MSWHRARFSAELVGDDLIVLVDLNGGKSITNDVEVVVRTIANYTTIGKRRIVYCDSAGQWDGIVVEKNEFRKFLPIGTKDRDAAISIARGRIIWR